MSSPRPGRSQNKNSMSSSKLMKHSYNEFVDTTTLHALPQVKTAPLKLLRPLWILIVLGLLGFLLWHASTLLTSYLQHPISVSVQETQRYEAVFPAVSLCNLNVLPRSILKKKKELNEKWRNIFALEERSTKPVLETSGGENSNSVAEKKCDQEEPLVRLGGRSSSHAGILEVKRFVGDRWGMVCDDFFDQKNAEVACRMTLGEQNFSARFETKQIYNLTGSDEYDVWLDDVNCNGLEDSLYDCAMRTPVGSHNCNSREAVYIECIAETASNNSMQSKQPDSNSETVQEPPASGSECSKDGMQGWQQTASACYKSVSNPPDPRDYDPMHPPTIEYFTFDKARKKCKAEAPKADLPMVLNENHMNDLLAFGQNSGSGQIWMLTGIGKYKDQHGGNVANYRSIFSKTADMCLYDGSWITNINTISVQQPLEMYQSNEPSAVESIEPAFDFSINEYKSFRGGGGDDRYVSNQICQLPLFKLNVDCKNFTCFNSGVSIPFDWMCDGTSQCEDGSDESDSQCQIGTLDSENIRISPWIKDGDSSKHIDESKILYGYAEIKIGDFWRRLCDQEFGFEEQMTWCKSLGREYMKRQDCYFDDNNGDINEVGYWPFFVNCSSPTNEGFSSPGECRGIKYTEPKTCSSGPALVQCLKVKKQEKVPIDEWSNFVLDMKGDYWAELSLMSMIASSDSIEFSSLRDLIIATEDFYSQLNETSVDELVLKCEFDGHNCNSSAFSAFIDQKNGKCFTFNQQLDSKRAAPIHKTHKTGSDSGLLVVMNIEESDYIGVSTTSYGVEASVHPNNQMAHMDFAGFNIPPGFMTEMTIKQKSYIRLKSPYETDCMDTIPADYLRNRHEQIYRQVPYSFELCKLLCWNHLLEQHCNCTDNSIDYVHLMKQSTYNYKYCYMDDQCCKENTAVKLNNVTNCACKPACNDTKFEITVAQTSWPSFQYAKTMYFYRGDRLQAVLDRDFRLCQSPFQKSSCNLDYVKNNLVALKVFFDDFAIEVMEVTPAYPFVRLIADFGGVLGLWVGISVATMIEIIQCLCVFLFRCARKRELNHDQDYELD